jgi:hypothetical protein
MNFSLGKLFRRETPLDTDVAGMPFDREWLAAIRPDDRFLMSYPRSGNRWLRTMLRDVFLLSRPEVDLPANHKILLPDIHASKAASFPPELVGVLPRVIKSHNYRDLVGRSMIYLYRQAPDSLVSFYHFHLQHSMWPKQVAAMGLDEFCLRMLPGWCEHLQLAIQQRRSAPETIHSVSYETLKAAPAEQLRAIVAFLGLAADDAIIEKAVHENSFEKSRARLAEKKTARAPILRKGQVGGAAAELQPATLETIRAKADPVYAELDACSATPRR